MSTALPRREIRALGYALVALSIFYVGCVCLVYPLWPWLPLWKWLASVLTLSGGAIALAALAAHIFIITRRVVAPKQFRERLLKFWTFDENQRHTHSWHTRTDFAFKELPILIETIVRAALSTHQPGELQEVQAWNVLWMDDGSQRGRNCRIWASYMLKS